MKVIFLDIDGVMNSHVFYEKRHKKRWLKLSTYLYLIKKFLGIKSKPISLANHIVPDKYYTFEWEFNRLKSETCSTKWKWLSEWCNKNNVKICISSVWKMHFGDRNQVLPKRWELALCELGFKPNTFVGITGSRKHSRGEEIQDWLNKHPEVTDYAILDDDSDMLPEQFDKFHHCDGWFGLSPNHLYRIERQFNGLNNYNKLSKIFQQ